MTSVDRSLLHPTHYTPSDVILLPAAKPGKASPWRRAAARADAIFDRALDIRRVEMPYAPPNEFSINIAQKLERCDASIFTGLDRVNF